MLQVNPLERAILDLAREMANQQLSKRIPDIQPMDYRRITYCLVEDRIAAYKAAYPKAKDRPTLETILAEFGITKKAYYAWYEKYHTYYKQCKKA